MFWGSGKAEMEHLSNKAPHESWSSLGLILPGVHVQNWIVMDAQGGISSLIGQVWGTLYRSIWATIWEWKSGRDQGKSRSLWPGKDVILGRRNTTVLHIVALFQSLTPRGNARLHAHSSVLTVMLMTLQMDPVLIRLLNKDLWAPLWYPSTACASVNATLTAWRLKINTEKSGEGLSRPHRSHGGPWCTECMKCSRWSLSKSMEGSGGKKRPGGLPSVRLVDARLCNLPNGRGWKAEE